MTDQTNPVGGAGETPQFDPDRVWGEGQWVEHENCPAALSAAGRLMTVTHSKAFHGRPLRAPQSGSTPSDGDS